MSPYVKYSFERRNVLFFFVYLLFERGRKLFNISSMSTFKDNVNFPFKSNVADHKPNLSLQHSIILTINVTSILPLQRKRQWYHLRGDINVKTSIEPINVRRRNIFHLVIISWAPQYLELQNREAFIGKYGILPTHPANEIRFQTIRILPIDGNSILQTFEGFRSFLVLTTPRHINRHACQRSLYQTISISARERPLEPNRCTIFGILFENVPHYKEDRSVTLVCSTLWSDKIQFCNVPLDFVPFVSDACQSTVSAYLAKLKCETISKPLRQFSGNWRGVWHPGAAFPILLTFHTSCQCFTTSFSNRVVSVWKRSEQRNSK